jgi:hypothetical protein
MATRLYYPQSSKFVTGTAEDGFMPIPVFYDPASGEILQSTLPKEMIKLIIFDLDGVLVEAKNIHFDALNEALGEYAISWNEHLSTYDGLKTIKNLEMLTKEKGLPVEEHQVFGKINKNILLQMLKELKPNQTLFQCYVYL